MRMSWPLDELAGKLAKHYGYPSKTAFYEGLVRWAAKNDPKREHAFALPISEMSDRKQDEIDEALLNDWTRRVAELKAKA